MLLYTFWCSQVLTGLQPGRPLKQLTFSVQVEPSPTTGSLGMAAIMQKIAHPDIPPSPRDKSVRSAHADGGSRDFEFKPHLNSSSQSLVHYLPFSLLYVSRNKSTLSCRT
jgi:hypothetical protein